MPMKFSTNGRWHRLQRWGTNALIASLLALMLLQTMPGVPEWLGWRPRAIADATGLWQFNWSMFTPDPDNENQRLRATITYHDGQTIEWQSPMWHEQSAWQRFVGHRHSEFFDQLYSPFNGPALPGFARWLAQSQRLNLSEDGRPQHIEIYLETTTIPDPRFGGWQAHRPATYEDVTLLHEEDFP